MILVVGGAGYIGSHVNRELYRRGYRTIVYDNLVYGHREAVGESIFVHGDLKDASRLEEVFCQYRIQAVFHFAAFAYVGESVVDPSKYYRNNVAATLNLLDTMVRHRVSDIVFSSTCAIYGNVADMPIHEDCPKKPVNPYGASKLMVERILADYEQAYGIRAACLRYFNAAGADLDGKIGEDHDPETHIIPLILDAAIGKRESIQVFGVDYDTSDGSCIRDYIHVVDLADAHIRALEYLKGKKQGLRINLGTGKGSSVLELVDAAKQITGKDFSVTYEERRSGDPAVLIGNNRKAKELLGWEPCHSGIDEIIETAWRWHCSRYGRREKNE